MTNTQKVSQVLSNLTEEELEEVSTLFVTFLDMLPLLESQPLEKVVEQAFNLGLRCAAEGNQDALLNAGESIVTAWEKQNADE